MKKQPMKIPEKVSVICVGNICRSPVGEYLLRDFTQKSQYPEIQQIIFSSAGTQGGMWEMHHFSRNFLYNKGIKSSEFISRGLSKSYLEDQDIILVLETYMKREIIKRYFSDSKRELRKAITQKMFTLREFAGNEGDIEDPYGMEKDNYLQILNEIENNCIKIFEQWENGVKIEDD